LQNENVKVFTAVFDREVSDLSNFAKGLQRRAVPHTHTHIFPMTPFTSSNIKACIKREYKHIGPSPPHCFWKENFI